VTGFLRHLRPVEYTVSIFLQSEGNICNIQELYLSETIEGICHILEVYFSKLMGGIVNILQVYLDDTVRH